MKTRKQRVPAAGEPVPALLQLKRLPRADRDRIQEWLADLTYKEAAEKVAAEFGIQCGRRTLPLFREFQGMQDRTESFGELVGDVQAFYGASQPERARARIREAALTLFMQEAVVKNDWEAFVRLAHLDRQVQANYNSAASEVDRISIAERELARKQRLAEASGKLRRALVPAPPAPGAQDGAGVAAGTDPKVEAILAVP